MKPTLTLLSTLLLAPLAALHAADSSPGDIAKLPAFQGSTPGVQREIDMPLVDLSADRDRHSVVAAGTESVYQGHCDTVLLPDGKTMFAAWCLGHAQWIGPIAKSTDAGRTWSRPLDVPANWKETSNTPALHRLVAPDGTARLFCFADGLDWSRQGKPPYPMHQAYSEDDGQTWTPMSPNGVEGEVPPKTILTFDDGKRLVMWSDLPGYVVQSESLDGGLTWSPSRPILRVPDRWSQPCVIRSADGRTHLMLLRENSRQFQSLYSVSHDNAKTWTEPRELPAALTGDRHVAKFAPDGRLVIAFRDMAKTSSTYGHYVAWVGTFENIVNRREGQYRIKLLDNANRTDDDEPGTGDTDCGYSDLELLADGTLIATTYIKYRPGAEKNSVISTRFRLSETDALASQTNAAAVSPGIVPANWDAALAGDIVLQRLVKVTAPQVKGAHDAEFVCVGDRAYVVSEANDLRGGESGDWPFIYSTLSIVNLKTLKTERVIDFAKGEQAFANETLPVGACWVPRIVQKNPNTLRCYFVSQDPGKRQSQMWYRDFDLSRSEFAPTIHKAKLKTAAGTFDFQSQHFHADAAAHGFKKKASDSFFFVFDSFKKFDGKLYVALNNFTGQQNALALVHDDLATFEVLGHYNEPQSAALSESAVNRLPDGAWMAICRNDKGNYHFTTSQDGRVWSIGEPKPFVPNGLNSKPTFDKFGGFYYLGWQEATSIQGANRSVFNVDISRDGKTWERKYRFETPQSFQYPTFHEHEGAIWLCVTQGDKDASRKERIMFGKLEDVGQFESQEGRKRIAWPPPPQGGPAVKSAADFKFTPEHHAAVNRQRRIFFQYDPAADIQLKGGFGSDMEALMGYVFDFTDMPGSQLDAICIDVSNEGVAHYRSKILRPIEHPGLMKWREEGLDYFDALIRHGHQRGKEIWWGLRMNEVERGDLAAYEKPDGGKPRLSPDVRNPVKAAHPDWLIRSWWWQGFWNYAVKEVRDYRLSIVREVVEQYDFDGVHLDFLRHTPHLPPGKQWENRGHLTTFLRDVRTMLQERAAERGRPFLLAARVPDSVEGCHTDGLDIETWAAEGLVDVLVLGTRTMDVDVSTFRKAMAGSPVKLIPSFDCYHATDGYYGDQSLDLLCGVFGNYLHQGADGVGIFNGPAGSVEHAKRLGLQQHDAAAREYHSEFLTVIGSLDTLAGKQRYYAIDRRGGYSHGEGHGSSNNEAPLPINLRYDGTASALTLHVWEPVKPGTVASLRLILFNHVDGDEVTVQLNGTTLKRDLVDPQWKDARIFSPLPQPETVTPGNVVKNLAAQKLTRIEFRVAVQSLQRGPNTLAIAVNRTGPFPASRPVKVEKVELHLK